MSFLDNLENTLKNLERGEDRERPDVNRRNAERAEAQAAAPHVEALKSGPFVNSFLAVAVRLAHASRTKVTPTWIGNTLRVDARERRLELRPTGEGVRAVFLREGEELSSEIIDLSSDPAALASRWLSD